MAARAVSVIEAPVEEQPGKNAGATVLIRRNGSATARRVASGTGRV
jgi:hypothetical protein